MQTKIIIAAIILIIATAGAWMYYSNTQSSPSLIPTDDTQEERTSIVATVNGEEITREQFETIKAQVAAQQGFDVNTLDEATLAQLDTEILESLISQALLRQAALDTGVTVPAEDIDAQVATVEQQFESIDAYQAALAAEGLTDESLRSQIERDLRTQAYLEQELQLSTITATEEEVNAAYEAVAAGQDVPPLTEVYAQVETMVIEQKQQERIAGLLGTLSAGADIQRTL
jgi:FKBP-type peptidyl-prolyl cis-trans isomerase (trigger factor)